jgi:hypothetical protein
MFVADYLYVWSLMNDTIVELKLTYGKEKEKNFNVLG